MKDDPKRFVFQGVHMMLDGDLQREWKPEENGNQRSCSSAATSRKTTSATASSLARLMQRVAAMTEDRVRYYRARSAVRHGRDVVAATFLGDAPALALADGAVLIGELTG